MERVPTATITCYYFPGGGKMGSPGRVVQTGRRALGRLQVWLIHIILLSLFFFIAGSFQGLSDRSLFLLISISRFGAIFYLVLSLAYQLMLIGEHHVLGRRFASLGGFLLVGAIYLVETGMVSWLNGT